MLSENNIEKLQKEFGLSYHVPYAFLCEQRIGLKDKRVLEVGGSLPEGFVFDCLGAKSWTAIETPEYERSLLDVGGITHQGTKIYSLDNPLDYGYSSSQTGKYRLFLENIEDLPSNYYGQFDCIFSIAAFEHIHKLPLSLEKMYESLIPGGTLFSMFSPIWSAHDGHHLPSIVDSSGRSFGFGNSPIPPWGHLLMRPPEMLRFLRKHTDRLTAELMVYYIYNAPSINRFFTEDYVDFVKQSSFKILSMDRTFETPINQSLQKQIELLHPGRRLFSNNGILIILTRHNNKKTFIKESKDTSSISSPPFKPLKILGEKEISPVISINNFDGEKSTLNDTSQLLDNNSNNPEPILNKHDNFEVTTDALFLGEKLYSEGKVVEAMRCFTDVIKSSGDNAFRCQAFNNIGVIAHSMNDMKRAEQMFISALEIDSININAVLNLSDVYLTQGHHDNALNVLKKAFAAHPGNDQISERLALLTAASNTEEKRCVVAKAPFANTPCSKGERQS